MNREHVTQIFQMFSGESVNEGWSAVVELACTETEAMLKDGAEDTDVRLEYLAASIANYKLQLIHAGSAKSDYNYLGKVRSDSESPALKYARSMMKDYYELCADLIEPQTFIFEGI
ncbi:MAG: hypothetical protein K5979_02420 [Ruminococcus sp.]|jgi:hypothetical protein|nr:hypothetical protein [Ruminococcus sp.]